jgi:hypothetical protein
VTLPDVTAELSADVSRFIEAWDRAADAAERAAARIAAAGAGAGDGPDVDRFRDLDAELARLIRTVRGASDAIRDLGNESRRTGDDVGELGDAADDAADRLGNLGRGAGAGGTHMKAMAAVVALVASVLPAVAAAALAAGAALQGLVIAGAVVAAGWKGIDQAAVHLKGSLGGLQKQLESVFRSGLSREFQQLGQAIAGLDGPIKAIAGSVVDVVKAFTGWIRSAEGLNEVQSMLDGTKAMVSALAPGAEAAAKAFTGFGAAASSSMDEIGAALSSVFENLNEVIQKGRETGQLEKAFQAGAMAIEAFGEVLAGVIDIMIEMAGSAGEPAADAIKKFGQAMQDAAPAIGTLFTFLAQAINILATVVGWFAKLSKACEPLFRIFNQANDGLTKFMKTIDPAKVGEFGKAIEAFAKVLGTSIKEGADKAEKAIKEWWDKAVKEVKDGTSKAIQSVKDWISKNVQEIKTGAQKAVQSVKDWWNKAGQEIKTGTQKAIQSVKDWINKTVQEIKTGTQKAIQAVKDWWNSTVQDVKDGVQKVIDEVNKWWDDMVAAVEEGVGKVVDAVKELPGKALDALAPWGKDMEKAGKDAGNGLEKGLASTVSKLVATAKAMAMAAMNAIKGALGIRSPSTVFRDEVGAMIPEGIAEGIIANSRKVTDAMRRTGLSALGAGGSAFGGAMGRGSGAVNVTLQVQGGADSAAGVFIARLAQQGKVKITANAIVGGRR